MPPPPTWNDSNDMAHAMAFGIGAVAYPDGGWIGRIDATTPKPYDFYVDSVRMWTKD